MARRRPLWGVQQAGVKIGLTLEAIANTGRKVKVADGEGVVVGSSVEKQGSSWRVRYQVRVRRVGIVWRGADSVLFG
jgi:hypothetical protein